MDGVRTFYARDTGEWRAWLEEHCQTEKSVWLIVYHKSSKTPSAHFHDVIENALCFGWVDSKAASRDKESCYLLFSRRNPKSTWGKTSRARAEKMIGLGLMTPSGLEVIEQAKEMGAWEALADAQNLVMPDDLKKLFDQNDIAFKNFKRFPPSSQRTILEWIARAKRPETRQRRVMHTAELAADNIRANHY
jgi:uncharacterized protein YdeI (YjbR/CyaY-like superfamily)